MSEEMSEEIKRIPIKEFRALGFVQEINRRLLHPCGLALEVAVNQDTGEETLGGIWDYRDDPDGIRFAEGMMTQAKSESVTALLHSKMECRMEELGYVIQPILEEEE